jgi:hypothetical protein
MAQDDWPAGQAVPNHEGNLARPIRPPLGGATGLQAEALSSDERRTLASMPGIMAKEKFLKGRRNTRKG